jgi:hypothetical protein
LLCFGEIKLPIFENLGYEQLGEFDKNKNFVVAETYQQVNVFDFE